MEPATLLQNIYKCYREKRLADMLELFDDNFRMIVTLPEDAPADERRPRSKAETAILTHKFLEEYDVLEFEPESLVVADGVISTMTRARFRHRRTGNILDTTFEQTWRIADGKAVQLEQSHDVQTLAAFMNKNDP